MSTRIILIVHTNTYFTGLLSLANRLKKSGQFSPIFLFAGSYPTLHDDIVVCRKESVPVFFSRSVKEFLDMPSHSSHNEVSRDKKHVVLEKLPKYLALLRSPIFLARQIFARFFGNTLLVILMELSRQINDFRSLIRQENISLVILPADNRYDQSAYIKAAHLEGVGAVVVPQFMASPIEWAEYVWDQPAYHARKLKNKLAAALYPRWTYSYKGRELVALPGVQIIARELLGIAPPLPWILHSGAADALALESNAIVDYCLGQGLPRRAMVLTGSIAHDIFFDILSEIKRKRDELCTNLGLNKNDPILLTALPPDSLYMGRPECDFQDYKDLVRFWCQSLASVQGYNHVVVLHPSVRYDEMKYIEDFGLKIAWETTMNIVPLCDVYVASISSTIQWAIACGKPVLNYDIYRYRYIDYQNVEGVITVEEQHDFLHALKQLTSNPVYYAHILECQARSAEKWGRLDGKAGERLQDLFASIIETYAKEKDNRE